MLDQRRIDELVTFVRNNLNELEKARRLNIDDFEADMLRREGVKHLLQISIEALLDIGTHYISHLKLRTPNNHREIIEILTDAGYLPQERQQKYIEITRFRNRIVHFYDVIDTTMLYDILQNELNDLRMMTADMFAIGERITR